MTDINVDEHRKEIIARNEFYFGDESLKGIKKTIEKLIEQHGEEATVEFDYESYLNMEVRYKRMENDKEVISRVTAERHREEMNKERRFKQFKDLQKEFGDG